MERIVRPPNGMQTIFAYVLLNFPALCTADPALQSAITPVGFNSCKSVPQTSPGNSGPLPNLGSACCSLMDGTKPLFGVVKSGSGICVGGNLVPDSFTALQSSVALMLRSRLWIFTPTLAADQSPLLGQSRTKTSAFQLDAQTLELMPLQPA